MKPLKEWFGLGPGNEDDGREYHWYNRHYEFNGTRVRLIVGDLTAMDEDENGGNRGPLFQFEVQLCLEDCEGEFYLPGNEKAKYDVHLTSIVFWRWGIYLVVRGRVYG